MKTYRKTYAFYHSADLDGHCSGAIIKLAYPEAELIGINYGDEFPWYKISPDTRVIMADFSLQPWANMTRMFRQAGDVIWIDHHKTAIDEYFDIPGNIIDNVQTYLAEDMAACRLCWRAFFPGKPEPEAVRLLGLFDVWKQDEDTRALPFQYGMRLHNTDPREEMSFWNRILIEQHSGRLTDILEAGEVVLVYQAKQNKRLMHSAHEVCFCGETFLAVNAGGINSLAFEGAYDPGAHYGVMSYFRKDHDQWTCSLYSPDGKNDLSVIAKEFGGGGHPSACGFQCSDDEMALLLS